MKPIDARLLAIFETEHREHVERLRALLPSLGNAATMGDERLVEEILRRIHTLKGAARAVGIESIELLAHRLEDVFVKIRKGDLAGGEHVAAALQQTLDASEDVLAAVIADAAQPDISAVLQRLDALAGQLGAEPVASSKSSHGVAPSPALPSLETVQVRGAYLDNLVRSSSRLVATREDRARTARSLEELRDAIEETEREWKRLRRAAARAGGAASAADYFHFIDEHLRRLAADAGKAAVRQERSAATLNRIAGQVHDDACRVLMVPAGTVFHGFRKMVRDLARDQAKEVEFRTEGLDVEADRRVLQALRDPVMHLLRNAVSHGIEPPDERLRAGKPRAGVIQLRLETRGGGLETAVEDDGRGIDLERVARVAVDRGLLSSSAAASWHPRELSRLILNPGFSTAPVVTPLSGRGLGLAAVHDEVTRVHGEVVFRERSAPGTCVVLVTPLSISTQHVLLARCGGFVFGIPARAVDRLLRISPAEIETLGGKQTLRVKGEAVPIQRLSSLLGLPDANGAGEGRAAVAVLRIPGERIAVIVDAFVDEREAIVQDLGLRADSLGMAIGGVALDDGAVAVVLNAGALVERFHKGGPAPALESRPVDGLKRTPSVLVVDDSLTTRTLERSILEAHGYRVRLAVDGVEALEQLRREPPDLVIADLTMPRMDGFELLRHVKSDQALSPIPVIIVSSLETREERERGLSLGAEAYIVKRKFDHEELLRVVRQVL